MCAWKFCKVRKSHNCVVVVLNLFKFLILMCWRYHPFFKRVRREKFITRKSWNTDIAKIRVGFQYTHTHKKIILIGYKTSSKKLRIVGNHRKHLRILIIFSIYILQKSVLLNNFYIHVYHLIYTTYSIWQYLQFIGEKIQNNEKTWWCLD